MHEYEIEVELGFVIADAADDVVNVTIIFTYAPREDGRGPGAYAGGEPGLPAEVRIQRIEHRQPGRAPQMLPDFMVAKAVASTYIEQLMFDHVEGR